MSSRHQNGAPKTKDNFWNFNLNVKNIPRNIQPRKLGNVRIKNFEANFMAHLRFMMTLLAHINKCSVKFTPPICQLH